MTAVGLSTLEDGIVILDEFIDETSTIISVPDSLTPDIAAYVATIQDAARRAVADAEHRIIETIAADFEGIAGGRPVLMATNAAAARVRSMVALRPRARRTA